jgi:uncharacterized protein with von Willebrand factor type A (vWA) domain
LIKKSTSLAVAVTKEASSKKTTTASSSDTETLIICLDCSGSMRNVVYDESRESRTSQNTSKMQVAIDAACSLIKASGILSHVGAVAFHDVAAEVVPPSTVRGLLVERVHGFAKHEGGTQFAPALRSALGEIASHKWGAIKRIIFMSDGEDSGIPETLWSVVNECAQAKVLVDTVMFGASIEGEKTLREIASKTGGVFCLAKDAASLRRTFMALEAGARGLLTGGNK